VVEMNILQIYDGYSKVGPESGAMAVVFQLSKHLVQAGHQVTILERKNLETDAGVEYIDGIKFVRLESKKRTWGAADVIYRFPLGLVDIILDGIMFAVKVNRYLSKVESNFDVIHVHFPMAANILIMLNRTLRKKMVYTFHGDVYRLNLDSRFRLPWYVRLLSPDIFLMKQVAKVILLNDSLCSKLISAGKIQPQKAVFISNGIDTDRFYPEIDGDEVVQKYSLDDRIVILYVGIVFPRKGVEYLVKAADRLINQLGYEGLQFLLVGLMTVDRVYVTKLLRFISDHRLEEEIRMVGTVPFDELRRLYSACDIFVLPSLEEACPMVVTEAMATGKPVIGTKVGGMLMQIRDSWNGFLVEPENEVDLAEKIKYLVDHPEERVRMGANSRKRAEEEFSWDKVTKQYIKVYQEVLR